jgi:hypothetical protein
LGVHVQQTAGQGEAGVFDGDIDGLFFAEDGGEGQLDGDPGKRNQVFVLDGKVLDVLYFQAERDQRQLQVAELDLMMAAGDDAAENVKFRRVKKAGAA